MDEATQDMEYFRSLVQEIATANPTLNRVVSCVMHDFIHLGKFRPVEPNIYTNVRGRLPLRSNEA